MSCVRMPLSGILCLMLDTAPKLIGKVARASLVMAFVKRDELSRFIVENQPIQGIARHYDRNRETVARAVRFLSKYEAAIARGDLMAVAKEIWRGKLGWERSESFIEARGYVDRGELMPKETCGPKRKLRRRPAGSIGPGQPAVIKDPAAARDGSKGETDDFLSDLSASAPLVRQADSVAARSGGSPRK